MPVIIDPFLTGNPAAAIGPDKLPPLDAILLSHGHGDHLGDAVALSRMLVPIGDNFTIGVEDAVRAVELVKPKSVIPMHYNTWDLIRADPEAFRRQVGKTAAVTILSPGESHTLS
jgi:L-ascorbate metabolism protein UlaG (beta-lactamase superfamily)